MVLCFVLVFVVMFMIIAMLMKPPSDALPEPEDPFSTYMEFLKIKYMKKKFPSYFDKTKFLLRSNKIVNLVLVNKEKKENETERMRFANVYLSGKVGSVPHKKTPVTYNTQYWNFEQRRTISAYTTSTNRRSTWSR